MKVLDSVAMKLLPVANAIGQQRHLQAIPNGSLLIYRHLTFLFDLRWG